MRTLFDRLRASDVVRHGLLVMVATTFGNACFFLYHAATSRLLGVAEYGSLYALITLALLVSLPASVLSNVITKSAAEFRALADPGHMRALLRFVLRLFLSISAGFVAVATILAVPLGGFMHVPVWSIPAATLAGCAMMLVATLRAVLQGDHEFTVFSAVAAIEGASRALLGAVLVIPFGLFGGVSALILSEAACGAYALRRLLRKYGDAVTAKFSIDRKRVLQTTGSAAACAVAVAILSSIDVVLVKHYFSPSQAGIYSAASLAGKIMLFVAGFAPAVLLPKAVDRQARGASTTGVLLGSIAMFAAIAVVGLAIFYFGGVLLLHALVGRAFDAAAPLLIWYAGAMALLAATNIFASYAIALHRLLFSFPLIAVAVAEIVAIALYHPSIQAVLSVMVAFNGIALVTTALAVGLESPRNPLRRKLATHSVG